MNWARLMLLLPGITSAKQYANILAKQIKMHVDHCLSSQHMLKMTNNIGIPSMSWNVFLVVLHCI